MNNVDEKSNQGKVISSANKHLSDQIRKLVTEQSFCVLCTQGQNKPYGSLIAYAFTDDLKQFFFTTPKATRKYRLLSECDSIAMVIDSRDQHLHDMNKIEAVTVTGKATQIENDVEFARGVELIKNRHPYLARFLDPESTALFQIDVAQYLYVTRFQEVSQWKP